MTFGYNSNFQPGSSKNKTSILDFSKELLFDMKYGRDDTLEEHEELGLGTVSLLALYQSSRNNPALRNPSSSWYIPWVVYWSKR